MLIQLPRGAERLIEKDREELESQIRSWHEQGLTNKKVESLSKEYLVNFLDPSGVQYQLSSESSDYLDGLKEETKDLWYMFSPFLQMTLPHSDPNSTTYTRTNGITELTWTSKEKVPYGKYARLLLHDICTISTKTDSKIINYNSSKKAFARRLGLTPGGNVNKAIATQLNRLRASMVTLEKKSQLLGHNNLLSFENLPIMKSGVLWGDEEFKETGAYMLLHDDFFEYLLGIDEQANTSRSVPSDRNKLIQLSNSCMSMDIYSFLRWRSFTLWTQGKKSTSPIPYEAFAKQIGADYCDKDKFKHEFRKALSKVANVDQELKITLLDRGFIVYQLPPLTN